jgi:molybdate transport system substrate-binding protein
MRVRFALLVAVLTAVSAAAADLSVLSAGAVESAVRKLAKHYEREFSRDVDVVFGTGPELTKRLSQDALADVLIAPAGAMANATRAGKVIAESQAEVARVGVGVVTRRGAIAPSVATLDALKDALLRAESVVYNQASTGQYLDKLFARIGVADTLKAKTTRYASAADVIEHVIRGRAKTEIGFAPITEIKDFEAKGAVLVAPLPADVQNYTVYVAAVMSDSRAPDAARDFVRYLTSAAARRTFAATGVETSLR